MNTPISAIKASPANMGALDNLLGVNINGSTKNDYLYTLAQLVNGFRKVYKLVPAGTTLTDNTFLTTAISYLYCKSTNTIYFPTTDFTQNTTTGVITATTFTFGTNDTVIVHL